MKGDPILALVHQFLCGAAWGVAIYLSYIGELLSALVIVLFVLVSEVWVAWRLW